eukprot:335002-Amphidinium_carterae.1
MSKAFLPKPVTRDVDACRTLYLPMGAAREETANPGLLLPQTRDHHAIGDGGNLQPWVESEVRQHCSRKIAIRNIRMRIVPGRPVHETI